MFPSSKNSNGSNLHKYSTEEHIVGEWIDGKPIYESIIELQYASTLSGNEDMESTKTRDYSFSTDFGISVDKLINYYAIGNSTVWLYNLGNNLIAFHMVQSNGNSGFRMRSNWGADKNKSISILIQYTKITNTIINS